MNNPPSNIAPVEFDKFSSWRQCYFAGVSRGAPATISLSRDQLTGLLSAVDAQAVVASQAALDPKLIINHKGTTVWHLLFFLTLANDRAGLEAVATGKSALFVPEASVRSAFNGHVNWPDQIIRQHPLELPGQSIFILPFLRHRQLSVPAQLPRSLRSPDGSVELLFTGEFNDEAPVELMSRLSEACKDINGSAEP